MDRRRLSHPARQVGPARRPAEWDPSLCVGPLSTGYRSALGDGETGRTRTTVSSDRNPCPVARRARRVRTYAPAVAGTRVARSLTGNRSSDMRFHAKAMAGSLKEHRAPVPAATSIRLAPRRVSGDSFVRETIGVYRIINPNFVFRHALHAAAASAAASNMSPRRRRCTSLREHRSDNERQGKFGSYR